jgi:D-specific alpha-keto acid dehydrogenase
MGFREPARTVDTQASTTAITVFGCGDDEAALFRAFAPRWGVSPTITPEPVSESNAALAGGARCISVSHKHPVTDATLLALSRVGVRYISTRSIGCNHIDTAYAQRVGITVGNVSYSPDSVADYMLMLMLMAVRHAKSMIRRVDAHDYRLGDERGRELRDLTVGVVGTGRIGSAVIDRLQGFGCRVMAHDPQRGTAARYVTLDDLLQHSDIVTLHTPLTAGTHHLLNRQRIARMRHGAVIVNTGRGALIDTEAVIAALESGRLGGAALDVVEGEEGVFYHDHRGTPVGSAALVRLQELPQALISPHMAYYTDHALSDTVENSIINCLSFLSGR